MNCLPYKETLITCPFDPAHRLLKHRFQTHLLKCARNHSETSKVTCPFNSTHVVEVSNLHYHMDNCDSRLLVDQAAVTVVEPTETKGHADPSVNYDLQLSTESWDDENVASYDPKKNTSMKPVLNRLDAACKSHKKEFQEQERQRFREFSSKTEESTFTISNPIQRRDHGEIEEEEDVKPPKPLSEILQEYKATEEQWRSVNSKGRTDPRNRAKYF